MIFVLIEEYIFCKIIGLVLVINIHLIHLDSI